MFLICHACDHWNPLLCIVKIEFVFSVLYNFTRFGMQDKIWRSSKYILWKKIIQKKLIPIIVLFKPCFSWIAHRTFPALEDCKNEALWLMIIAHQLLNFLLIEPDSFQLSLSNAKKNLFSYYVSYLRGMGSSWRCCFRFVSNHCVSKKKDFSWWLLDMVVLEIMIHVILYLYDCWKGLFFFPSKVAAN